MIKKWISRLTTKQIVISLVMVAVAIYVVWYVIEALEGLNREYQPYEVPCCLPAGSKGGMEIFNPTKKTPEAVPAK